ncbi:mpv17-like protein [Palaemon carinicauda]|uniref:mpv17-like protein n=1 Tax=Palaemon carinicauda TaxID=392227 RepID=UPI0035B636D4
MALFSKLRKFFRARPLLKNMMGYGIMYVGAEFSQQTLLKKVWKDDPDPNYDVASLGRYTFFGVLWYPVAYNYWYRWLDSRFVGKSLAVITKKSLLDQFLMEPPLLASFYVGMSILEGKDNVTAECKKKFGPTFLTGCVYWLPAMALNFWLMPNSMRVLFLGVCTFIWVNFICWYKRK